METACSPSRGSPPARASRSGTWSRCCSSSSAAGPSDDLGDLWREIAEALSAVLDRVSFGDLKRLVEERRGAARPMYHI